MGLLQEPGAGALHPLPDRLVLGRSRLCWLRVDAAAVSAEHAALWWTGAGWRVRDLGSLNGTWVGGRRLAPGEEADLRERDTLGLGVAAPAWILVDAGPPAAMGRPAAGGDWTLGQPDMLLLPSLEHPEQALWRSAEGTWMIEGESGAAPVGEPAQVLVAGAPWLLHLPVALPETQRAAAQGPASSLHIRVSRDEEYVEVVVRTADRELLLPPRAFHYVLLTLARARLADAAEPTSEQGWLDGSQLAHDLQMDRRTLNAYVYRIRKQWTEAGGSDAEPLVERRAVTGQIRLGIRDVVVRPMGD